MIWLVWGIDLGDEAVTYRRDPDTGKTDFGVHRSAATALPLRRRMLPDRTLSLVWDDGEDEVRPTVGV